MGMTRAGNPGSYVDCTSAWWLKRTVPLAAAVLVGVVLSSTIIGCRTQEHFFDVSGELHVLSAAEHYDEALDQAIPWKPDAYLSRLSADVASSRIDDNIPDERLTYMFDSPTDADFTYVLDFIGGSWSSDLIPAGAVEPPIQREDWLLDSVDAWSIALANGGEDLLTEHQDPLTVMLVILEHVRVGDVEDVLVWRVVYLVEPGGPGNRLDISIDPKTGDILQVVT